MRVADRRLTPAEAAEVVAWRYPPPYDVYVTSEVTDDVRPVLDGEVLTGFVCFGAQARVAGQAEVPGVLDVGAGLAPDRVGQGAGTRLWPALRTYALTMFAPDALRTAVAAFNERSTRLCLSAGFVVVREFAGPGGRPFRELLRLPA